MKSKIDYMIKFHVPSARHMQHMCRTASKSNPIYADTGHSSVCRAGGTCTSCINMCFVRGAHASHS